MNVLTKVQPKVLNPFLAGAIVTVIVWALSQYGKVTAPPEVSAALVVIVSVIVGYWSPPVHSPNEVATIPAELPPPAETVVEPVPVESVVVRPVPPPVV